MAIFTGGVVTQGVVASNAQFALLQLRKALHDAQEFHEWLAGLVAGDLVTLGFTAGDAQNVLDAFADAAKLADLWDGGDLGTYTLPYPFAASARRVIGPLRT